MKFYALLVYALASLSLSQPALAVNADAEAKLKQGIDQQLRGELSVARTTLNKIVKEEKDWARPHIVLAMVLLEQGDGSGARMHVERAIALKHPRRAAQHLLAHARLLEGNPRAALEALAPAQLDPRYAGYAARVRALALDEMGKTEDAGASYDEAVQRDPGVRGLWVDVAEFRMRAGDLAGAIEAAVSEVRQSPRSQRAMMLVGNLVRNRYGLVAALPWFRRAVALEPGNLESMGELAATLGDAGHTIEMLAVTRKMIEIDPQNARAFYLQAVLAARANKPDLARALLYRTGGKMDDVPAVILLNAVLEMQAGSPELSIARLNRLVEMQPDNLKARRLLGAAMWRAGDAPGAVDILDRIAQRGDADSYTLSIIGRAYEEQGDREEAALYLDRVGQAEGNGAAPFDLSGDLVRLARARQGPSDHADQAVPWITQAVTDGRLQDALAHAQRMANLNPGAPAAQILEGDAFAAMGRHGDAIAAYRRAADLRFNEPVALRMVDTLLAMGNGAEALRVLDYFLSQNPRSVPGLLLAADHFMSVGRWDPAIAVLSDLRARLGGRDAAVAANLGWAFFNKGQTEKALVHAREAYTMLPSNPNFASGYGWILHQSKRDVKGGIAIMRKAVAIAPDNPEYKKRLEQALGKTGKGSAKQKSA